MAEVQRESASEYVGRGLSLKSSTDEINLGRTDVLTLLGRTPTTLTTPDDLRLLKMSQATAANRATRPD